MKNYRKKKKLERSKRNSNNNYLRQLRKSLRIVRHRVKSRKFQGSQVLKSLKRKLVLLVVYYKKNNLKKRKEVNTESFNNQSFADKSKSSKVVTIPIGDSDQMKRKKVSISFQKNENMGSKETAEFAQKQSESNQLHDNQKK